ncbi:MAG: riboflavin synthase [Treponema sp.]|nr:riboflavin synthase [Treponema sp.]
MFTGIVEEIGRICSVTSIGDKARLTVGAARVLEGTRPGDSISIDGACQTVTAIDYSEPGTFTADTLRESLKKTTLGNFRPGTMVNLERALCLDSRMGGHIVQGHIACTVWIRDLRAIGNNVYLTVEIPDDQLRYCVPEGSIALDGISLTIAGIGGNLVTLNIIPATLKATGLGYKKTGDKMNLETDIIGRYVERLLMPRAQAADLSFERLHEMGY